MKEYSTLCRSPKEEPHYQMLFSVILRTPLLGVSLSLQGLQSTLPTSHIKQEDEVPKILQHCVQPCSDSSYMPHCIRSYLSLGQHWCHEEGRPAA